MSKLDQLARTDIITQCEGNIVSDMDGEKVMLSIQNGKYYNLGETGGRVWELIAATASVEDVINLLTEEYDVEQSLCEQQVLPFLNHLLQEGLIRLTEEVQK